MAFHTTINQFRTVIALTKQVTRERELREHGGHPKPIQPDRRGPFAKFGISGLLLVAGLAAMVWLVVFQSEPLTDAERLERAGGPAARAELLKDFAERDRAAGTNEEQD